MAGQARVDPHAVLAALAERGLTRVLCEDGPTLAGTMAAAGTIDELCLSVSPLLVGSGAASRILASPLDELPWPIELELHQVLCAESMLLTRYTTVRSTHRDP